MIHTLLQKYNQISGDLPERSCALPRRSQIHRGFQTYRSEGQQLALATLQSMEPNALLQVNLPTGGGKSQLFFEGIQILNQQTSPHERQVGLVIVPTVGLAHDHEESARGFGVNARALTGAMSKTERDEVTRQFKTGDLLLLILNPESLTENQVLWDAMIEMTKAEAQSTRLAALFVDEAHIVESWGRHFRPAFQRLKTFILQAQRAGDLRVILLSATFNSAAKSFFETFATSNTPNYHVRTQDVRRELYPFVLKVGSHEEREGLLLEYLDDFPKPMVIYTTKVEHARQLSQKIQSQVNGAYQVRSFHGETNSKDRQRVIQEWRAGQVDLVVATSAFGMGIDKHDVRCVIHACLPEDASRYYQEIGRAGRDGNPAFTLLMHCDDDLPIAKSLTGGDWLSSQNSAERWAKMMETATSHLSSLDGVQGYQYDIDLNALRDGLELPYWQSAPGEYNRLWNATLLSLVERAGGLKVVKVSPEKWSIFMTFNDALRLARHSPENALKALLKIFTQRDQEKALIQEEQTAFFDIINDPHLEGRCLLIEVFKIVEDSFESEDVYCGQCHSCVTQNFERDLRDSQPMLSISSSRHEPSSFYYYHIDYPTGPLLVQALNQLIAKSGPSIIVAPPQLTSQLTLTADTYLVSHIERVIDEQWHLLPMTLIWVPTEKVIALDLELKGQLVSVYMFADQSAIAQDQRPLSDHRHFHDIHDLISTL